MKDVPSQMEPLEEKNLTSHPVDRGWSWLILAGKVICSCMRLSMRISYFEQVQWLNYEGFTSIYSFKSTNSPNRFLY